MAADGPRAQRKAAFLLIDVQNDFCPPDGSLAVAEGTDIIPIINDLREKYAWDLVVLSQDWHPANHMSFYENNKDTRPDAQLFVPLKLEDGSEQMMWPVHCVQGSKGSEFHPDLKRGDKDIVVQKGKDCHVDSYSAFQDNDRKTKSEMTPILKAHNITDVFIVGLAYDYCVGSSAIDALEAGFNTYVLEDCTRGVAKETIVTMVERLKQAGVKIIQSSELAEILGPKQAQSSSL